MSIFPRRILLLFILLFTLRMYATFWDELKQAHPDKIEVVDFLSTCIDIAGEKDSDQCIKNFAWSIAQVVMTYPPGSIEWENLLTIFQIMIKEYKIHPMEFKDLLQDKEAFLARLKEKVGFLYAAGPGNDLPEIK